MDSRYRTGEPNPLAFPTFASDAFTAGAHMWWDATNKCARPASVFTWNTDLATTQGLFHDLYLGAAGSSKIAGDTKSCVVNQTGRHDYDCASASFDPGALVGPAKQAGNALEDLKVVSVASAGLAVGRVQRYSLTVVKVAVEIEGTFRPGGGVQAFA